MQPKAENIKTWRDKQSKFIKITLAIILKTTLNFKVYYYMQCVPHH